MNWLIWSSMVNSASAVPKAPFASRATKGWRFPAGSTNQPPISHSPVDGHDSDVMLVGPPLLIVARPGTETALCQVKLASVATNASCFPLPLM